MKAWSPYLFELGHLILYRLVCIVKAWSPYLFELGHVILYPLVRIVKTWSTFFVCRCWDLSMGHFSFHGHAPLFFTLKRQAVWR